MDGVTALPVHLAALRLERPRAWGACWIADALWRELKLDEFFAARLGVSREGTDWEKVLRILAIYRLLSAGSEWRLHRHWFATTALADLLGVDAGAVADDTLYRCLDLLLAHKEELFSHLRQRWSDLFGARYEVLLYDLTSSYFECDVPADENDPRRFGYSRDRRGDCVQVVVALVVTPEGLPLAYEMLSGNTADRTTLRAMIERIQQRHGKAERIWVMDRGIPTEAVLEEREWQQVRPSLRVKLLPQEGELYVLAHSAARAGKERGMRQRKLKAYWKRLGELAGQKWARRGIERGAWRRGWCE